MDALENLALLLELLVLLLVDVGEAPLLGDDDLLATGEFITGTTKGLLDNGSVGIFATNGKKNLANVHAGHSPVRFAPGTTHTGLKSE